MTNDAASLDRLHDIVVPKPVPWWPPAPGWYFVMAILLVLALVFAIRALRRHLRNAYRREAIALLKTAHPSAFEIAKLLKRVALTAYPREQIAHLTGQAWVDWLSETSGLAVPSAAKKGLSEDIYSVAEGQDVTALAVFATQWIRCHAASDLQVSDAKSRSAPC